MDKTKVDWCDSTWNPVTGCIHGCEYCYARGIANRFGSFETIDGENIKVINTSSTINCVEVKEKAGSPYPEKFTPTFHRHRLGITRISQEGIYLSVLWLICSVRGCRIVGLRKCLRLARKHRNTIICF